MRQSALKIAEHGKEGKQHVFQLEEEVLEENVRRLSGFNRCAVECHDCSENFLGLVNLNLDIARPELFTVNGYEEILLVTEAFVGSNTPAYFRCNALVAPAVGAVIFGTCTVAVISDEVNEKRSVFDFSVCLNRRVVFRGLQFNGCNLFVLNFLSRCNYGKSREKKYKA